MSGLGCGHHATASRTIVATTPLIRGVKSAGAGFQRSIGVHLNFPLTPGPHPDTTYEPPRVQGIVGLGTRLERP